MPSSSLASGSSSSRGETLQERCDRYRDEREDALRKLEDLRRQFKHADNTEDWLRKERDALQQDVWVLRTKLDDEEERSERRREEREEWREKFDRILTLIKQGKPPSQRSVRKTHKGRRRSRKYKEERRRASTAPPPKSRSHK